jgi:hypothetical protein
MKMMECCEYFPWNAAFSLKLTNRHNKLKMFHNTRLERLANDKQSNLLVQFVSYESN